MNRITNLVLSHRMAYLMLTCFAIIPAIAVTLEVYNGSRISDTYAKENTAAEQENTTKENTPADIRNRSLATSQEAYQPTEILTPNTASVKSPPESTKAGSSKQQIPCAWSDILISPEDFNLICTTVYCEAGNQSIETQIMTALTILNRLSAEEYPDTVKEVIYQDNQYSVTEWTGFLHYGWTGSVEQAVTYALEVNGHPKNMYFFRTKHYHEFGQPYRVSDDLYFSTSD